MIFERARRSRSGFTLVEILVATGVFGLFVAGLLTTWTALQTSAVNTTTYARRQNDQMRAIDYLKRDIRRASGIEIYDGGTPVTGTAFGNELRLTVPDYYTDSREEDDAFGTKSPSTPTVTGSDVNYGTALNVRYYVSNGAIIREESGIERTVTADRFRQVLEANLKPYFGGERVTARFERLGEERPSADQWAGAQQNRATFTIIAATTLKRLPAAEKGRTK